jgi:hypothetical protein
VATVRTAPRRGVAAFASAPWSDMVVWGVLTVGGTAVAAAVRRSGDGRLPDVPPFARHWPPHGGLPAVVAAVLAALVVLAGLRGWAERLPWRAVLGASFLVATAWALALAATGAGLTRAAGVDALTAAARAVGADPGSFLDAADTGAAGDVPPGGILVVWALQHAGVTTSARVSAALTVLGSLAVPCILVAVRSLCHEPAARRLAPVLSIAPFAVWTAGSIDAVVLALTAAAIACGLVGSEPRRTPAWAAAAGFLLGAATLVSYVAWGLAAAVVITYFVRRRPLPNLVTGFAFLVPLFGAQLAGFVWSQGFGSARTQLRAATSGRPGLVWLALDVVVVVAVAGPTLVASARKIRRTPGWPFLVGATIGLGFAVATGLSRGDGERALLPFLPWLLVAAVAPERRPTSGDPPERTAAVFPAALTAVGAAVAVLWQVLAAGP